MMHHVYKSHEKFFNYQPFKLASVLHSINQNTRLTINRDSAIIASHSAAFFNMLNHASYCLLSHQDVIILNPAYKQSTRAIKDNIHSTRFIATLIVCSRESSVFLSVQGTFVHPTQNISQNHRAFTVHGAIETHHKSMQEPTMINLLILLIIY
jgi:hypothetical protein